MLPTERRAFSRLEVLEVLHGRLVPFGMPVILRDLSVGGFSLESDVPFRTGSQHVFRFTMPEGAEVVIESTVIHCAPVEAGANPRYVVGCAFVLDAAGHWMQKVSALVDALEMLTEPADESREQGMSNDTMTLHLRCPLCEGSVTLHFDPWTPHEPPATHEAWRCPHCREPHTNCFPGKLDRVAKRRVAARPPAAGVRLSAE